MKIGILNLLTFLIIFLFNLLEKQEYLCFYYNFINEDVDRRKFIFFIAYLFR